MKAERLPVRHCPVPLHGPQAASPDISPRGLDMRRQVVVSCLFSSNYELPEDHA